jgi:hypothetical protein
MTMETTSFNHSQIRQSREELSIVSKFVSRGHGLVAKAVAYLSTRRQQVTDRLAFKNLLTLEANILQDIGVTKEDVIWASKLPLSKNAALELEKIARANRNYRPK